MAKTRVAVAGAGSWARHAHLPALAAQSDIELIGVVDPLYDRAREAAALFGIPHAGTSLAALLADERPDLLIVAAPTAAHAELCTMALQAGVAVLCEKPLAASTRQAQALVALASATALSTSVGFSFRYAPALQALKRDIVEGVLGAPWLLELFEYNAQFHPAGGKLPGWKGDPEQVQAGALLEYGSHLIDLAGWLVGPIDGVQASYARVLPKARVDDIATLQLRFAEPAIGILVASWALAGSAPGIRVRYHGAEGLAEAELSEALPAGQAYRRFSLAGVPTEMPLATIDGAHGYALRHSADMIRLLRGEPALYPGTLPSFADGSAVQLVLDAAQAEGATRFSILS